MTRLTARPILSPLPRLGAALALAVLAALPAAAADIYQWKDANGVTHYSDSPPPNQNYQNRMITHAGASQATAAEPAKPVENDQCTKARTMLGQLRSEGPVGFDANDDGKPDSIMEPEQRAKHTRLAEAAIAASCSGTSEKSVQPVM